MTVNITMLTHGRPRLTGQSLETLRINTDHSQVFWTFDEFDDEEMLLGTGKSRNKVIELARKRGGKYLYLSDNDVYFKPFWLEALIECFLLAKENAGVLVMGAYNHPYNQPVARYPIFSSALRSWLEIAEVYAVSTQSWLMEWSTWDKYGPFKETPPGMVRMSEDWEFCQRIRNDGFKVATVLPPLICNTALTDTNGQKVPGWELIEKEPLPEGAFRE